MVNSRPNQPLKSLSVGDVVSTGVRIYRSHFKTYFKISLIAGFWSFIPVYGWAKLLDMLGSISRLAFAELNQSPESPESASQITDPLKWRFLGAAFLTSLYFFVAIIGFVLVGGIIVGVLAAVAPPLAIALGIILLIVGIILLIRLSCRLLVYDVALAVEQSASAGAAINRSMNLSKGSVGKIQFVVVISYLLVSIFTLPFQFLRGYVQISDAIEPLLVPILSLLLLVLGFLSNTVVLPFWQVVKAVIYFDLRTRREGYGLKLRDQ